MAELFDFLPDRAASPDGVAQARRRLDGAAALTPLLESAALNERLGGRIFLKAEPLQIGGSFKFRGAFNLMARLSPQERARGVLAWSSGNHAQGVALAAKAFGAKAVIVMPQDAPRMKAALVRRAGADIVPYDRYKEDREEIGLRLCEKHGYALAPSYDHPDIIEGQGTLTAETVEQASERGAVLDAFVYCCGGGGLAGGGALALEAMSPATRIFLAEPEGYDEFQASIAAGEPREADVSKRTLCDAIATPHPGALTFPILKDRVEGGASVSDDDALRAMAFAFAHLKVVLEPGGAVALAAALKGAIDVKNRNVALTLSGGNVDPEIFSRALERIDEVLSVS